MHFGCENEVKFGEEATEIIKIYPFQCRIHDDISNFSAFTVNF
jgi:hypothetical protein